MSKPEVKEKKRLYPRHHLRYDLLMKELDRLVSQNPNDADLGKKIRKLVAE